MLKWLFAQQNEVLRRQSNQTPHQKGQFLRKHRSHEGKADCHLPLHAFQRELKVVKHLRHHSRKQGRGMAAVVTMVFKHDGYRKK